jgi:hypothetical protein
MQQRIKHPCTGANGTNILPNHLRCSHAALRSRLLRLAPRCVGRRAARGRRTCAPLRFLERRVKLRLERTQLAGPGG